MRRLTTRSCRRRPAAHGRLRLLAAGCGVLAGVVGVASGWGGVPLPVVVLLAAVVAAAELVVLPARLGSSRWAASLTEGAVSARPLLALVRWIAQGSALHTAASACVGLRARRAVGAPDFDRCDLRNVDVLVARADAWLGAPPDGDVLTPEPAVVRVRASVERLDALAARGAAGAEVAAELHELERAVAALLGTAGLPAAAVPQQRSGPPVEWTTTGAVR